MSGIGFNTGLKALLGSQVGLDTVGHNIANVGVNGYSQQNVNYGTSQALNVRGLMIGSGVNATSIQRSFDNVLEGRIQSRLGIGGSFEARMVAFEQIESVFAEPNGFSLGTSMDDFFGSMSDLSTSPNDGVLRTSMAQAALDLTSTFNQIAGALDTFDQDTSAQAKSAVNKVNDLAGQIAIMNQQISETEASGVPANDLRDQRGILLEGLADVVGIKVVENSTGAMHVSVGGATLVGAKGAYKMSLQGANNGKPAVNIQGVVGNIDISGGALGAQLDISQNTMPGILTDLDKLAKDLIFQMNKVHSTGVPAGGPFKHLVAANSISDADGDGKFTDELLNNGSLPFDVKSGDLYVTMTEDATGEITKHKVGVNGVGMTLGELADALDEIPHLDAEIGSLGNLRVVSEGGYGFDFSPTLDSNPDNGGTFGSGKASLGTQGEGPFALSDGQTLDLSVDVAGVPTPLSITFNLNDFKDITEATSKEIAAVINSDPSASALGIKANTVGEHFFLQSAGAGELENFTLTGGSALGGLGWTGKAGQAFTGSANSIAPVISGTYTGDGNGVYNFVPTGDGVIGTTPGLGVQVFDEKGELVVTLDVGEGYVPGSDLTVANGVSISFGLGNLSASNGDHFQLDTVSDSDTSDVLVALGLNSLFTGSGAVDISLRADIELDPDLIAAGFSHGEADGGALLSMFNQKDASQNALGGETFDEFYSQFIGGIGFEASTSQTAYKANDSLLASLELQREQVSGVNMDEQLIDLMRYEQSYSAAIRYITVVDGLNDAILNLV
jgi:flagellar hook-associated protein FlgK